jgi:PhnB protein
MQVQPYLFFNGKCEEALEFYKKMLGAKVTMVMRFGDAPDPEARAAAPANNIMHSEFQVGESTIMASDGMGTGGKPNFQGFSLTIQCSSDADVTRLFHALAEGGQVEMPLAKAFFASNFGGVRDKYGVSWMVINPVQM